MAPKKDITAAATATEVTPAPPKAPKAPRKPAAKKPVSETDGEKKPRNMSACSSEFVSSVHAALPVELSQKLKLKEVKEVCEAFVKTLVGSVLEGKNVNFTNHMSFARRVRAARVYKNLKTKESITKPKHYVMTMAVKPNLKKQFDEVAVAEPAAPPA